MLRKEKIKYYFKEYTKIQTKSGYIYIYIHTYLYKLYCSTLDG